MFKPVFDKTHVPSQPLQLRTCSSNLFESTANRSNQASPLLLQSWGFLFRLFYFTHGLCRPAPVRSKPCPPNYLRLMDHYKRINISMLTSPGLQISNAHRAVCVTAWHLADQMACVYVQWKIGLPKVRISKEATNPFLRFSSHALTLFFLLLLVRDVSVTWVTSLRHESTQSHPNRHVTLIRRSELIERVKCGMSVWANKPPSPLIVGSRACAYWYC